MGQTDGQTDGLARRVIRPIGRPHNKGAYNQLVRMYVLTESIYDRQLNAYISNLLFQYFPQPPDITSWTFKDQSHFPGLSRA